MKSIASIISPSTFSAAKFPIIIFFSTTEGKIQNLQTYIKILRKMYKTKTSYFTAKQLAYTVAESLYLNTDVSVKVLHRTRDTTLGQ